MEGGLSQRQGAGGAALRESRRNSLWRPQQASIVLSIGYAWLLSPYFRAPLHELVEGRIAVAFCIRVGGGRLKTAIFEQDRPDISFIGGHASTSTDFDTDRPPSAAQEQSHPQLRGLRDASSSYGANVAMVRNRLNDQLTIIGRRRVIRPGHGAALRLQGRRGAGGNQQACSDRECTRPHVVHD
jgi:hypothetical protein